MPVFTLSVDQPMEVVLALEAQATAKVGEAAEGIRRRRGPRMSPDRALQLLGDAEELLQVAGQVYLQHTAQTLGTPERYAPHRVVRLRDRMESLRGQIGGR